MKRYIRSATYNGMEFNDDQMEEIQRGLDAGVDVSVYADPKFDSSQMWEIRTGLEQGFDVSLYADPKFNGGQMWEIRVGFAHDVDPRIYANPKYNREQMAEIRSGLEAGVDVSVYADPKINWRDMRQIRKGPENEVRVTTPRVQPFNLTSREVVDGVKEALGVSTDVAKIMVKWYALDENPNDCKTVDEYVDELVEAVPYSLEELLLNEDMEDIRDEDPKYAREVEKVARALGIELDD